MAKQDMGVAGGCLDGQCGFLGEEASRNQSDAGSDERHLVSGGDHHSVANPNERHAQEDEPGWDQIAGMMFHRGDGVQSHVNGCVALALNAQHALIQGDFHPFRWFCQPEGQEGFLVRLAGWCSPLPNLAHPMSERGVRGYQTTAGGSS